MAMKAFGGWLLLIVVALAVSGTAAAPSDRHKETSLDPKHFADPGKEYRPSPFWSWNDDLRPEELRWQVRQFAEQGFGGYFMHSRVGLATPYLSEEWMDRVRACLEEGRKVGTESWLYDEDKWPSGFAGGLVTAGHDEFRARSARLEVLEPLRLEEALKSPSTIAVYRIRLGDDGRLEASARVTDPATALPAGERYVVFREYLARKSNWYNGESYADLLNPAAVEEFLKHSVDAYAGHFRRDFGEWMPGIFTDEPNYMAGDRNRSIPWTDGLPGFFRQVYGYDLLEKLPLLYLDGEGAEALRYDFWRAATLRFVETFTRPYAERCEREGLAMTGHYLMEDNLQSQVQVIGAAMPHYEYMQVPGIDHLGRNINDPLTLKQCSSVAHQFGRPRVLCEIFGVSGHSMSFEDQKWMADFHFALGITFLCQHLTLYTMKGDQKRDYPPTISYHQPYWPHYRLANDYFARAAYLCSQGRFMADLLLLHPIGSAWATYAPRFEADGTNRAPEVNASLVKLQDALLALHRDFDYGDETILSRHARVEGGEVRVATDGRYRAVVVPPSLTWSRSTFDLLRRFLAAGGKVFFVGETPTLIDARPARDEWERLLAQPGVTRCEPEKGDVERALDAVLPRGISVADDQGQEIGDILIHHRAAGTKHIFFLASTSRTDTHQATVTLPAAGRVTEWDLVSGEVRPVPAETRNGRTTLRAVFLPVGSHAFVVDTAEAPARVVPLRYRQTSAQRLAGPFAFERLHPNSLTLDTCRYSLNGGEWVGPVPVWKARKAAWNAAGLGAYAGIQPWALEAKGIHPTESVTLALRTGFRSEVEGRKVYLVLESPDRYELKVNGQPVSTRTKEWHWDKQFGKLEISGQVRKGENTLELSCRYGMGVQVEDLYLVGSFGVRREGPAGFVLVDEPETLKPGDWGEQGYPMYAGTMRYRTTFRTDKPEGGRVLVRLKGARGSLFRVSVNGGRFIPVTWQPWEADVTSEVRGGENELVVEVVSTLRNTFGPLHHVKGDNLGWVGPGEFVDERNWTDEYQLVPYGLIEGVEVVTEAREQ